MLCVDAAHFDMLRFDTLSFDRNVVAKIKRDRELMLDGSGLEGCGVHAQFHRIYQEFELVLIDR